MLTIEATAADPALAMLVALLLALPTTFWTALDAVSFADVTVFAALLTVDDIVLAAFVAVAETVDAAFFAVESTLVTAFLTVLVTFEVTFFTADLILAILYHFTRDNISFPVLIAVVPNAIIHTMAPTRVTSR